MLFQKEKDYGNTITKIGRKKNKKNETAKKKRKIKKERKCSLKNRILASSMVRRISNLFLNTSSEKVSFCALNKKASLALETALVLPMFLLGMVTMISFMDIYRIQTEHLQALCEKTKEAGMNHHLTKPVDLEILEKTLGMYCEGHKRVESENAEKTEEKSTGTEEKTDTAEEKTVEKADTEEQDHTEEKENAQDKEDTQDKTIGEEERTEE